MYGDALSALSARLRQSHINICRSEKQSARVSIFGLRVIHRFISFYFIVISDSCFLSIPSFNSPLSTKSASCICRDVQNKKTLCRK